MNKLRNNLFYVLAWNELLWSDNIDEFTEDEIESICFTRAVELVANHKKSQEEE